MVAKTDFEKDLYKLMKKAVFSKMMENVRNKQNMTLLHLVNRRK